MPTICLRHGGRAQRVCSYKVEEKPVVGQFDIYAIMNITLVEEARMKGTPTQKQGNNPRQTKKGKVDVSGDGMELPKFRPPKKK